MSKRETELGIYDCHKTPKQVAKYMRTEGSAVGRKYKTHGDVWNVPSEVLQVGLLHLVVDRLEAIEGKIGKKPLDMMAGQSAWLARWHDKAQRAIAAHKQHCKRISKFCDLAMLRNDVQQPWDIHELSKEYRLSFAQGDGSAIYKCGKYYKHWKLNDILKKNERLKTVRSLDDIEKLSGIGSATAKKIREKYLRERKVKIEYDVEEGEGL